MAAAKDQEEVQITAQCLCKAHSFTATVLRSSLPLEAAACHCNSCRRVTGALYSIDALWPGDYDAIRNSNLKKYSFSEKIKVVFCSTCGSAMFWEISKAGAALDGKDYTEEVEMEYGLFTGVLLDNGPKDLVRLTQHIFVADTLDGGATPWLQRLSGDGEVVKRWAQRAGNSEQLSHDWPGKPLPAAGWKRVVEEIPVRCHCKGVDLVFRQAQALKEDSAKQPAELSRYVDPVSRKPVAGMDACSSCRTSSGVDFFNWTFANLRHIGFPAQARSSSQPAHEQDYLSPGFPAATLKDLYAAVVAETPRRDPRLGTLGVYNSSDGVNRYFCSRCSACVFYAADKRHDVVNVAMGLLDSPDGARAEGTCMWLLGGPVPHREDVMVGGWREDWLKALEADAEAWRTQRNFPEWWRLRK